MKTTLLKKASDADRKWVVIDASGIPLGRVAAKAASILRGKEKATFTPHLACGDFVIVKNASRIVLTGNKARDKMHYRHSGYPGGLKAKPYGEILKERPDRLVEIAVKGMLPKNRLGRDLFRNLRVYAGEEHPHKGQDPVPVEV